MLAHEIVPANIDARLRAITCRLYPDSACERDVLRQPSPCTDMDVSTWRPEIAFHEARCVRDVNERLVRVLVRRQPC